MPIEIERKYLATDMSFKSEAVNQYVIEQGFLNSHKERTVRIRIANGKGLLTIKGKSSEDGLVRFEWEKELGLSEAQELMALCEPGIIVKTRYVVPMGKYFFEVDEFHGNNEGLVIAELELNNEQESIQRPIWLGKEITGEIRYYNSQLAKRPFKDWE